MCRRHREAAGVRVALRNFVRRLRVALRARRVEVQTRRGVLQILRRVADRFGARRWVGIDAIRRVGGEVRGVTHSTVRADAVARVRAGLGVGLPIAVGCQTHGWEWTNK